jgi:hypothetical protein
MGVERPRARADAAAACGAAGEATPLAQLKLARNELAGRLPDEVGRFRARKLLDVSHNKLQALPSTLAECPELKIVQADHNALAAVEDGVFPLPGVVHLALSHNQLTAVPAGIAAMHGLTELLLAANALTGLPEGLLGRLARLLVLDLAGNALHALPQRGWEGLVKLRVRPGPTRAGGGAPQGVLMRAGAGAARAGEPAAAAPGRRGCVAGAGAAGCAAECP